MLHPGNIGANRAVVGNGIDPKTYDHDSQHLPLAALSSRCCHWPVNDPARGGLFLFCGEASEAGRPYCPHHGRRAVGAGTESERTAHRVLRRAEA